ncbi:MAG: oxygen-dependent coproporphyrinogen oxidase [Deltaproteobacteria bacterium]|nr:oxygen-dependent coproporphyrinogen oxidase [Deltaproteobacteria bacterium]
MDPNSEQTQIEPVKTYLMELQDRVCAALESIDQQSAFVRDEIPRAGGGISRPRVLTEGRVCEKAAVNFTHTVGHQMPPAATERRPELSGAAYQAVSMSLIVHPRNPHAPTCHANFRCFSAQGANAKTTWWFGGGFDLTPYYGYKEDAILWHKVAKEACDPFGSELYPRMKQDCDQYFFLPHRQEPRGIGGIFFDDFEEHSFEHCFGFVQSVGNAYLEAYLPILERRKDLPYSEKEREFQLYRRGRYVEFNLLQDRGTRFGLQAATRTESVLASLPPRVTWRYDWHPEPGSPEESLYTYFLQPRDWVNES